MNKRLTLYSGPWWIAAGIFAILCWACCFVGVTSAQVTNGFGCNAGSNCKAKSIAIGGATLGTDALAVTGGATFNSGITTQNNVIIASGSLTITSAGAVIRIGNDTTLTRPAAAVWQHGSADAASPVAQTITAQSVVAGTTNTAAPNFTFDMPKGTGTGIGGSFIVRVAPAGTTGSTPNAMATALTIDSTKTATFSGNVFVPSASINLNAGGSNGILSNGNFLQLYGATGVQLPALTVLGGTTNAFPALKRSGVELQVRAADDSAYGNFRANIIVAQSYLFSTPVTVSALASCTGLAGARQFVTDATVVASGNFAVAVTGGGANTVPVYCDGIAWKIG